MRLTLDQILRKTWTFRHSTGAISSKSLELNPDGSVSGYRHANEHSWRIFDNALEFLSSENVPTSRLHLCEPQDDGRLMLRGPYLTDPALQLDLILAENEDAKTDLLASQVEASAAAGLARIAVFITFHYRNDRLVYLASMIRSLGHFPVDYMCVHICTNTQADDEVGSLKNLGRLLLTGHKDLTVHSFGELEHSFDLTWSHKALLVETYEAKEQYTHFIYAEDDIEITFANFVHFIRYADALAEHGLIPGFARYEYNLNENDFFLSDYQDPINASRENYVRINGVRFVDSPFPYMATFTLTRAYLKEYMATRSFDKVRSQDASDWWIAERSAMGLTWENVPPGFRSRLAIAIDSVLWLPLPDTLLHHLPDNYTNCYQDRPEFALGRIKITDAFRGVRTPAQRDTN